MKHSLFLCFLALAFRSHAQENRLDAFFSRCSKFPIESVYLHCDRHEVLSGDSLWFTAYIFENNIRSTISTNLYVELFNKSGRIILQELFPIVNSLSVGQLTIPDSLKSGNYWVRAFTRYQLNFDSVNLFRTPVAIFNKKETASIRTQVKRIPKRELAIARKDSLILIATETDTGLVCHLDADQGWNLFDRKLDLVLASYHQPIIKATFTITHKRSWKDVAFAVKTLHGTADLLLFSGDSLLIRQPIYLDPPPSPKLSVHPDTINFDPGSYNVWTIKAKDFPIYNCSIAVSDADAEEVQPFSILQSLGPDPFDYRAALAGTYPVIRFQDTDYLNWNGKVKKESGKPIKYGELIAYITKDSFSTSKPQIIPIDEKGRFNLNNLFFFDSAYVNYQLNSFDGDPAAKKIAITFDRFVAPGFSATPDSLWKDTVLDFPGTALTTRDIAIPPGAKIKELPPVTVKADIRKELDDRYATGLFSELTPYSFDLRTDKTVNNIWAYLRKNLAGFQGGLDIGQIPSFNGKGVLFYVDNQVQSLQDVQDYWYEEIAYIKAFPSLWIDDTPFMRWKTGYTGATLVASGGGPLKAPSQNEPPVICLYTRKGADIRTGWAGLKKQKIAGYTPIARWTGHQNNRSTLYWQPLQSGNSFTIRFYNTNTKRYKICIEGISQNGNLIHYEQVISAQDQITSN